MDQLFDIHEDDNEVEQITNLLFDSDDEEKPKRGGSVPGRAPNIDRNREEGAKRLYNDYFSENPTYPEHMFSRRFRMPRRLFLIICERLEEKYEYFKQRPDATGLKGFTTLQKCTVAMRLIAYGTSADSIDEYGRIGASTALEFLKKFAKGVVECFKDEFLRPPNKKETEILLQRAECLGFPGMLGSIDCCKWVWKNCPTAHHGQHKGKEKVPTITMECIGDDRLYIWHAFFGIPGCNNDITVLEASPISASIANATYPVPCEFEIDGVVRNKPYWLSDNIYPKWPCFVHSILNPSGDDESYYAGRQEGRRKDIERAFGVLQAKYHIVALPSRLWKKSDMTTVMYCCLILHNMVVNEKRPLVELESRERTHHIRVTDDVECCFVRDPTENRPIRGTIAAVCATQQYMNSILEYMNTRRLIYSKIVSERKSN